MALLRPLVLKDGFVQVLKKEDVILGNSFSFRRITTTQAVYVPDGQQHIVVQSMTIEGAGELVLQGDAEQVIILS